MAVTPKDVRQNEVVATAIVEHQPKDVSGHVGIIALGKLTELLRHDEFVKFVSDALHHATTGEIPPDEDQEQENPEQPAPGLSGCTAKFACRAWSVCFDGTHFSSPCGPVILTAVSHPAAWAEATCSAGTSLVLAKSGEIMGVSAG